MRRGVAVRLVAASVPLLLSVCAFADDSSNVAGMKVMQIALGVITGVIAVMVALYTAMKFVLNLMLQTDEFRAKLMGIVYRDFDSRKGREQLRDVIFVALSSHERARVDSKNFVEESTRDVRQRVQPKARFDYKQTAAEIAEAESDLENSPIQQQSNDPLIYAPETRELVLRVLRALGGDKPKPPEDHHDDR